MCQVWLPEGLRAAMHTVHMRTSGAALEGRKAPGELFEAGSWAEIEAALFGPAPEGSGAGIAVPRVLAIAGSDSGGGAGVQASMVPCPAAKRPRKPGSRGTTSVAIHPSSCKDLR